MTHHFSLSQWKINKVIASWREPLEWPAFYFPLFSLTHAFQSHVCLSTFLWLSLIKITLKCCYFWLGKPGKPGMLFWKVLTTMMIYNHLFQSNYKTTSIVKPSTVLYTSHRCQNIPTSHYKALDSSVPWLITWSTSFRRASYFYFHIIIWRVSGASLLTGITFNKKVKTIKKQYSGYYLWKY